MTKPPVMKISQARIDHPTGFSREIGRIIVRWALIEYLLQATVWDLAGVNDSIGRLAIREPRVTDRLALLEDLAGLHKITLPKDDTKILKKALADLGNTRDLLAHGVWVKEDTGKWYVILGRGSYPHNPTEHSKNRRIDPEGLTVSLESLKHILGNVTRTLDSVRNLRKFLTAQLRASADK